MKKKHRNSQPRYYVTDGIYFVTFYPKYRLTFFKESIFCNLFIEKLCVVKRLKQFKLFGFSIVYDHVHLMIKPDDSFNISDVIHCIKRNFSRDINKILSVSDVSQRRSGEDMNPRLWSTSVKFKKFRWQKSFHDHIIRDDKDFERHWKYIKWNPTKHGLPDDWPYIFTNPKYYDLIDQIEL